MSSRDEQNIEITSLRSISRGASFFIMGKIVLDILEFILNLILTRTLGSTLYGIWAYANTVVMIALVFTNLGSDNSLLKYVPQYEDNPPKRRLMVGLAYLTSFLASLVVAAGLFLFAPAITRYTLGEPLLVDVLRLFAVLVVFDTMVKIFNNTFRSLEVLEYQVLVENLAKPVVRLTVVGLAILAGLPFFGVMAAFVVASAIIFSLALYLLLTRVSLRPSFSDERPTRGVLKQYYNFSVPLMLKDAGSILRGRIDIVMVGFFLSSTAVGIYNVTLLISGLLSIPLGAINQLFPPVASRLYSNDDLNALNAVFSIVTRWCFTLSLFIGVVVVMLRFEILAIFGDEFTRGAAVLVFFVFSSVVSNAVGPSGYLLMVSEHQYILLMNQWVFGVLNVFLNYWFILEFGLIGAALATASVSIIVNIVKLVEIWYLEGLFPYTWGYAKPLVAATGMGGLIYGLGFVISGLPLIFLGFVLGGATYLAILSILGIDSADKEFFNKAIRPAIRNITPRF